MGGAQPEFLLVERMSMKIGLVLLLSLLLVGCDKPVAAGVGDGPVVVTEGIVLKKYRRLKA